MNTPCKTPKEQTILVTGGAGFIGSNFIEYLLEKYPGYRVVNLDKLTYAVNPVNLRKLDRFHAEHRYTLVHGDIVDRSLVERLFSQYSFVGVIHFAASTHVDRSILEPDEFVQSNFVGTFTLLDTARKFWMSEPNCFCPGCPSRRFHHVSTDEVYGSISGEGLFSETTACDPRSPYSASKAGSDMLTAAWYHTYGMNVTISRSSNNFGPGQHEEKLIPKIVACCRTRQPIPLYGDGQNVRDWLYVGDHCHAIDLVFHQGRAGQVYNIGGHNERTNLEIVHAVCRIMDRIQPWSNGSYCDLLTFVADRPGHDRRYALDTTKIETELGWRPEVSFDSGLLQTVQSILGDATL